LAEKILVIDDEKVVLDSCKKILTAAGYDVVTQEDPREGLKLVETIHFDAVLSDWNMPGFDGMDVVTAIGEKSPDTAVVMITGYPTVERATEAMQRGALNFLVKPFKPEELVDAVKRAEKLKIEEQKKDLNKVQQMIRSVNFPTPEIDDKPPKTIAETVSQKVGVGKTTSPWFSVLILGILAGAYIGFGGVLATTVTFDMAANMGTGFAKFMSGSVFSLGLMLVIIAGAELFTGNNLMISSVMTKDITFGKMLKRWGLVYVANFIGSIIIVLLYYYSGLWKTGGNAIGAAAVKIAAGKVSLPFSEALFRAIGCNWIVCLAVWMALSARQTVGKIFAIFFPIMGFVAIGFEHSVANMYFIPIGIVLKSLGNVAAPEGFNPDLLNWGSFFIKNLIPVTIGNIIGGVVFVGMSYWSAFLRPKSS